MELSTDEINALVTVALAGGVHRAGWNYRVFAATASQGLTEIISKGKLYNTHKLTVAGMAAVLALPDDYSPPDGFYPRARDILKAKAIVRGLTP